MLGDIHSSKEDLEKVLCHIEEIEPGVTVFGTGDLYECIISKKDITEDKFTKLKQVMLKPKGFTELLDFQSVRGNQEERIILISETDDSLRKKIAAMPEIIDIGDARIINGHQWEWGGNPWSLIHADVNKSPVFFGHRHHSSLTVNGIGLNIEFDVSSYLNCEGVLVNFGAVVGNREWALYNPEENTVRFMKAY